MCTYKNKAFTIIELLIVISVLGVLISLLQPSLNNFIKQSEKLVCLNNFRQINAMANLYKDDHNGSFYQMWHQNPWNLGWHSWGWIMQKNGYVDLAANEDMIYCPSTEKDNRQAWWSKFFTYGVNQVGHHRNSIVQGLREVVRNNDGSDSDYVFLDRAPQPSEYMFMLDTKASGPWARGKAMIYNFDASWNARVWQSHNPGLGANSLYADGHAAFETPETFYELFGSGINFAYQGEEAW